VVERLAAEFDTETASAFDISMMNLCEFL